MTLLTELHQGSNTQLQNVMNKIKLYFFIYSQTM